MTLGTPSVNESLLSSDSIAIRVNVRDGGYVEYYSTVVNGMRYKLVVETEGNGVSGIIKC